MTELKPLTDRKPCPFCGNRTPDIVSRMGEYWGHCDICHASTSMLSSYEQAIEAWNKRSTNEGTECKRPESDLEKIKKCSNCKYLYNKNYCRKILEGAECDCYEGGDAVVKQDFYCKYWDLDKINSILKDSTCSSTNILEGEKG